MKVSIKVSVMLVVLTAFFLTVYADDRITVSTYYPSPYGSYRDLDANQMRIGVNYTQQPTAAPVSGLIVEGNVGIGTNSPQTKLDVRDGYIRASVDSGNNMAQISGRYAPLDGTLVVYNNIGNWFKAGISAATNSFVILNQGDSIMMTVDGPTGDFSIAAEGYKPTGGTWGITSDRRLKDAISNINGKKALEIINQLQGVEFKWRNPEEHVPGIRASLLAQDLVKVFPQWVGAREPKGKDTYLIPKGDTEKTISFPNDFFAYLIEAVKELKKENEELKARVDKLENKK